MPRPRKCRTIHALPPITYYKPRGIPMTELEEACLSLEGLEALRLSDYEGLSQEQAALRMDVSRQTFGRILALARQTVAQTLVRGLALKIEGGHYEVGTSSGAGPAPCTVQPADFSSPKTTQEDSMEITKLAISSEGPTPQDMVDPRFGRAVGFIIYDAKTGDYSYRENGMAMTMAQGAGIQTAENMVKAGVQAVLTGYVGPKAFAVLNAAGVQVGLNFENQTVEQVYDRFKQGKVQWSKEPNKEDYGR